MAFCVIITQERCFLWFRMFLALCITSACKVLKLYASIVLVFSTSNFRKTAVWEVSFLLYQVGPRCLLHLRAFSFLLLFAPDIFLIYSSRFRFMQFPLWDMEKQQFGVYRRHLLFKQILSTFNFPGLHNPSQKIAFHQTNLSYKISHQYSVSSYLLSRVAHLLSAFPQILTMIFLDIFSQGTVYNKWSP